MLTALTIVISLYVIVFIIFLIACLCVKQYGEYEIPLSTAIWFSSIWIYWVYCVVAAEIGKRRILKKLKVKK